MNEFRLLARLIEKQVVRYTPAGVPVVDGVVAYQGTVEEGASPRDIEFELNFKALGDTALSVNALSLNCLAHWTGFIARRSKTAKSLVFHITGFRLAPETNDGSVNE